MSTGTSERQPMTNQVIPAEAVEAAAKALYKGQPMWDEATDEARGYRPWEWAPTALHDSLRNDAQAALEAAAPHMLIHVHHHNIEHHARSFNEGYETCMAQELADNPSLAQDWLDEKLAGAKADALEEAAAGLSWLGAQGNTVEPNTAWAGVRACMKILHDLAATYRPTP